jgi:hypothetical protein
MYLPQTYVTTNQSGSELSSTVAEDKRNEYRYGERGSERALNEKAIAVRMI